MGKLVLYGVDGSPPVRACKMTLDALGLQYDYQLINPLDGENRTKEYLAKNPQHTIPTLEDDGKSIWDSHAIMAYLVRKYGKNDQLYPKDFYQRAVVDQRLHFESGVIFQGCLRTIARPLFFRNAKTVPQESIDAIYEAYMFLESFLADTTASSYIAGSVLTIADFSCISTITSLQGLAPIDAARFPKLSAWIERMRQLPNYMETNGKGAQIFIDLINDKIKPEH